MLREEALMRIREVKESGDNILNLSFLGLKEIPKELEEATDIIWLNLSNNQIKEIKNLDKLTNIEYLDLSDNIINEVKNIDKLTNITELHLSYNKIKEIKNLDKLTNIGYLDLSDNKIKEIKNLDKLTNITELPLSNNKIKEIKNLDKLTSIIWLDLHNNQIKEIKNLDKLTNITYLHLSNNKIKEIKNLDKLTNITHLHLYNNQIKEIKNLDKLTNITHLHLYNNQIKEIKNLDKLTRLRFVNLLNNNCIDLSNSWKSLKTLNFDFQNKIHLNHPPQIPQAIIEAGEQAFRDYIQEVYRDPERLPNKYIKLILVGNSTVGKTSLTKYLLDKTFISGEVSTHGIQIKKWNLTYKSQAFQIQIWDFGGQEYYHATHRLFLGNNAVYLFLCDVFTNKNHTTKKMPIHLLKYGEPVLHQLSIEHFHYNYWLEKMRYYAPDSPILFIQNKTDFNNPIKPSLDECNTYNIAQNNIFHLDIKKAFLYEDLDIENQWWENYQAFEKQLKTTIANTIERFYLIDYWEPIQQELAIIKEQKKYINYDEFINISINIFEAVVKNDPQRKLNIDLLIIYLRDIVGEILYYPNHPILKETVFIDPIWVSQSIYEVLSYKVKDNGGRFNQQYVEYILQDKQEARNIIALMLQFELIFPLADQEDTYIAPQYLPDQYKESKVHEASLEKMLAFCNPQHAFTLRFPKYFPKSIFLRFLSKYGVLAEHAVYWKYGILFNEKKIAIYVSSSFEGGTIRVAFQETKEVPTLQQKIFETLLGFIHEVDFEVALEEDDDFNPFNFKAWKEINQEGNGIEQLFGKITSLPDKFFIVYDFADKSYFEILEKKLGVLARQYFPLNIWTIDSILPGQSIPKATQEMLQKADIIILLLSDDLLYNKYKLIDKIMQKKEKGTCTIIPIILKPCLWDSDERLLDLQVLPKNKRPVLSWSDEYEAWQEVAKGIREWFKKVDTNK